MAGLKQGPIRAFNRSIRARGITSEVLAREIGTSRPYVCRMINNDPKTRQGWRWLELQKLLTDPERELLKRVTPKV